MALVKVAALEVDGEEFFSPVERLLVAEDTQFNPAGTTLLGLNISDVVKELSGRDASFSVTGNGELQTTSTNPILVTGMTLTPPQGVYDVIAFGIFTQSQNTGVVRPRLYFNGSEVANTLANLENTGSQTREQKKSWSAVISGQQFTGTQSVEIRWSVSAGTGRVFNRYLYLRKLR